LSQLLLLSLVSLLPLATTTMRRPAPELGRQFDEKGGLCAAFFYI
jgi:hypothetical protein